MLFFHLDQKVKNKLSNHYRIAVDISDFANESSGVQLNEYSMIGCDEEDNNDDLENLL